MATINKAYLLLGSNLGNRKEYLSEARSSITKDCGDIIIQSALYLSKAWGDENQSSFINQVLLMVTEQSPQQLLQSLLAIEIQLGRERRTKWSARTIDIDILFFNELVLESKGLTLPHPRITERNFTLVPLMEIASDLVHPELGLTIEELYLESTDTLDVIMIEN